MTAPASAGRSREWDGDGRLAGARVEAYKAVGGGELLMYVFGAGAAAAGAARPGIVFFHGGGWEGGSPAQFGEQCKHLARRGMVAVCAEYRVESRHGALPRECLADAKSAMRWARANARQLGLDPDRLAAGGGSAGGHLAAATALVPDGDEPGEDAAISPAPQALVLFNPVLDTTAGRWQERFGKRGRDLSPLHHVRPGAPPAIVFHGAEDAIVSVAQAEAFAAAMHAAGSRCELVIFAGAGHGFFNYARGPAGPYLETLRGTDRFLASLGWLSGEPGI